MKQIANLDFNRFKTQGEVKEGLPLHEENLIAYYPLEGDTLNIIPEVKVYVKDNELITKGIKSKDAITLNNVQYENNMIKFNGTNSSYAMINSNIFNADKSFKIELEYIVKNNNKDQCILFIGNKDSVNPMYSIWHNGTTNTLSMRRMNGNQIKTIDICAAGESVPEVLNKISIVSKQNKLFSFYMNNNHFDFYYNFEEIEPTQIYAINDNNYFEGYIKSITVNTYDDLNISDNKPEVYDCGFIGGQGKQNYNDQDDIYYSVGWTLGVNLFFEKTDRKIYNMPIYKIIIKPDTQELLDKLKNTWSVGIKTISSFQLEANQDSCSYLLYRPLTFVNSVKVSGMPSNSITWKNGKEIDLKNDWRLAYKYRDPDNKSTSQKDCIYWTFFSNDMQIGDELVIECSPIIVLKDTQIPIYLSYDKNEYKNNNYITASPKIINDNINEFSISYEWIPMCHSTDELYPVQLWLGPWSNDSLYDWIGLFYRGRGWDNSNSAYFGIAEKDHKEKYIETKAIPDFNNFLGDNIKIFLSYNKQDKQVLSIAYNKTKNKILSTQNISNINFNEFNSMRFAEQGNDLLKNLAIYNKSFSIEQMISMCKKDFKIMEDGSVNIDGLKEFNYLQYKDSYYLPLDNSSESICGRLDSVNHKNLFVYKNIVDGFIYDDNTVRAPINKDFTSDYIPIDGSKTYVFKLSNDYRENTPAVAWYDSNKHYIRRDIQYHTGPAEAEFSSPANAKFARITSRWKGEVKIIFKEKSLLNAEYVYEDGGLNAGKIQCKAFKCLTPDSIINEKFSEAWDENLHSDACAMPNWFKGYNGGVENPTIGYHAKWVNEGPRGNVCAKYINHNSLYNVKGRWMGVSTEITEFLRDSNLSSGDKIQIVFKAKSDKNVNSYLQVGIYRKCISTGQNGFYKLEDVVLNNAWKDYVVEVPVDSDWSFDNPYQAVYFYGGVGNESVKWASDIYIVINGSSNITTEMLKADQNLDLSYNLTDDIDMDWTKPWHISFWRKPISGDAARNFSLWSLGVLDNFNINKGYIYSGYANNLDLNIEPNHCVYPINFNDYINQWGYISIDYDGSKIYLRHRGEKYSHENVVTKTITAKNYFKHPDQKSDLFLGSYRGLLNNATIKDLLIIKNKCLTKDEEDKIFRNLMRYDYTLSNRINIKEENFEDKDIKIITNTNETLKAEDGQDLLV